MTDSQNKNAWNDWANYLLYIVKKHDGNIDTIQKELKTIGIQEERIENLMSVLNANKNLLENLDKGIVELEVKLKTLELVKLDRSIFEAFYADDYKVFKAELLTAAKLRGMFWGAISGFAATALGILVKFLLNL